MSVFKAYIDLFIAKIVSLTTSYALVDTQFDSLLVAIKYEPKISTN